MISLIEILYSSARTFSKGEPDDLRCPSAGRFCAPYIGEECSRRADFQNGVSARQQGARGHCRYRENPPLLGAFPCLLLDYSIFHWSFKLVCQQDSPGLPAASEARLELAHLVGLTGQHERTS